MSVGVLPLLETIASHTLVRTNVVQSVLMKLKLYANMRLAHICIF